MRKVKKYTVGSLYAGIGGIDKGFIDAGAKVLWANEFDKYACRTYRDNFNHLLIEEDVYKLDPAQLKPVDIIAAGFPCQAFSVAGYRKGFEDARGNHFFRVMQIAEILKPRVLFLENVKNFRNHDNGKTWQIVHDCLIDSGYTIHEAVLNTKDYGGIPQTRERFYGVCFRNTKGGTNKYSGLFNFPVPVPMTKSIHDLLTEEKVEEKYYYDNRYMSQTLKEYMKKSDTVYQWRRHYVRENKSGVCPTLTANMGTGGHNVPLVITQHGIRKLTPLECFRFQGFESIKLNGLADAHYYKQAGNSVSVPVIKRIAENILSALTLGDGAGQE